MYAAYDTDRRTVIRRGPTYGGVLQFLFTCGYYDPESYIIYQVRDHNQKVHVGNFNIQEPKRR